MATMQEIRDIKGGKNYIFVEEWGCGKFGKCYLVLEEKSQDYYACKLAIKESLKDEANLHCKLKHRNIVQFISNFSFNGMNCTILEACENGTVQLLLRCRKVLTDPEVRCIATQVTHGLDYLHDRNIIHRDIKLANLLLSSTMAVKIADFGLSRELSSSDEKRLSLCGTKYYVAPEIINQTGHGLEVDIWGLGCVVYTLLDGKHPFKTNNKLKEGQIVNFTMMNSPRVGAMAWAFLKTIFITDPAARPTAKTILNHIYFKSGVTLERLQPSVFCKKPLLSVIKTVRKPLQDITNSSRSATFSTAAGKENARQGEPGVDKTSPSLKMSLRARKHITDLPTLPDMWFDKGVKVAERMLKELEKITILKSNWQFKEPLTPFVCVRCWVAGIGTFAYRMNNGTMGINFSQGEFFHRSTKGEDTIYGPDGNHKRLTGREGKTLTNTLQYIEDYLNSLNAVGPGSNSTQEVLVVVKKNYIPQKEGSPLVKPSAAFLLSNGSCQMNFSNHDKMIINLHQDLIVSWNEEDIKMCSFRKFMYRGIPNLLVRKIEQICHFLVLVKNTTV